MKRVLYVTAGVALTLVLAAGALLLTFDIERHKGRIEAAVSAATGMQVRIIGGMSLKLLPRASLALEDVFVQNRGLAVVSARLTVARLRLLPLLRGAVRVREVVFSGPKVFVTKDGTGRFNFESGERDSRTRAPAAEFIDTERILVTQGYLLYRDVAANSKLEARECNLAVRNLLAGGGRQKAGPSFEGEFSCREAGTQKVRVSNVRAIVKAGGGTIAADPVTMKIFGGDGRGRVRRVTKGGPAEYAVDFAIAGLRFEEVLGTFGQKKNIIGELDLESHLTLRGGSAEEMTRTAQGEVALRGRNLRLKDLDVDRLLGSADRSQRFNLIDVGAFLVAGPLGTLLTKGYDFASIYQEIPGAKSAIPTLVSVWKVRDGVAEAEDAAFATEKNRFALKGKLDFVHERFEDLSVAVLNAQGCAISSQRIHGDFKNPQIDPPLPRRSVLGPVIALLKKPFEMLQGGECAVYYRGSVQQP